MNGTTTEQPAADETAGPTPEQRRLIERQVETALLEHPAVADATVVLRGGVLEDTPPEICTRCGMDGRYPGLELDAGTGVCSLCTMYEEHRGEIHGYFGEIEQFAARIRERAAAAGAEYDCLLLFSGGKDSTYVLHQLVRLGLRVMTFTFDNGFISKTALVNVETITSALGIEHVTSTRADQNRIFVKSLKDHKSVCNGCFRSLLDLANQLAYERGIPSIVTGLSRGQIIDERLLWFYREGQFDAGHIEQQLAVGRQIYHQVGDGRTAGPDAAVDEVEVVDYYRYSDVTKDDIRELLAEVSDWAAPKDTGFCSSNCMINDVGVYVHKLERGFHNYESPTRWEVRLGHLARAEADQELRTPVNTHRVKSMLARIGYGDPGAREALGERLTAYYVPRAGATAREDELRTFIAQKLPEFLLPAHWTPLEEVPRTNGAVRRRELPDPLDGTGKRLLLSAHGSAARATASDDGTSAVTEAQRVLLDAGAAGAARSLLLDLTDRVELAQVQRAVLAVVLHHEALRSRFSRAQDGQWHRSPGAAATAVPVAEVDLSARAAADGPKLLAALERKLSGRLDPAAGPLAHAVLVRRSAQAHQLLLVVHELAADIASWRVLLSDLATALTQIRSGAIVSLPPAGAVTENAEDTSSAEGDDAPADTPAETGVVLPAATGRLSRLAAERLDESVVRILAGAPGGLLTAVGLALHAVLAERFGGAALTLALTDHRRTEGRPARLIDALAAPKTLRMPGGAPASGPAAVALTHLGNLTSQVPDDAPFAPAGTDGLRLDKAPASGSPLTLVLHELEGGGLALDWWCGAPLDGALTAGQAPHHVTEWLTNHAEHLQERMQ